MPNAYPDFITPEQMLAYVRDFAQTFGLTERIRCGVTVQAVEKEGGGQYTVVTDQGVYRGYDHVVFCTGLHGKPDFSAIPGLDAFQGTVVHGSQYKSPDPFIGKHVLCIGLGESGFSINAEVSRVAAQTVVSSSPVARVPRVFPHTRNPLEQMQFWPINGLMKDYQELLSFGISWLYRVPAFLRPLVIGFNFLLKDCPAAWRPETVIPARWHGKFWPKPVPRFGDVSGNLTRPEAPSDDVVHLVKSGQILPKGRVERVDATGAIFADGSRVEADAIVLNVGYQPTLQNVDFPEGWHYRHLDLYKGCFHPQMPNLAFVGMVRPTIGSIPAMAEMQARWVAQVFAGNLTLPTALETQTQQEAEQHKKDYPTLDRLPHVYFFDRWMEEMAELMGCRPQSREHLGSWKQFQAFWVGPPQPLRFRLKGPGAVSDGYERYADRVATLYGSWFGLLSKGVILGFLVYPHLLAVLLAVALIAGLKLSVGLGVAIALLFWILYMKVDLFRFVFSFPLFQLALTSVLWYSAHLSDRTPQYAHPQVFQTDANRGASGPEVSHARMPADFEDVIRPTAEKVEQVG